MVGYSNIDNNCYGYMRQQSDELNVMKLFTNIIAAVTILAAWFVYLVAQAVFHII